MTENIIKDSAAAKVASVLTVSAPLTARIKCNFYNGKHLTKQQYLAIKDYLLMKQQLVLAMAEIATPKAKEIRRFMSFSAIVLFTHSNFSHVFAGYDKGRKGSHDEAG